MPYKASVYNVMIASPSDVNEECQTIRDAIFEWNYKHSRTNGIVLMPLGWETHSAPLLSEAQDKGGQKIINDMVSKHSDVLVAIFKTRIGSPTGRAASGTIEEIELHYSLGKPVLRYFGKQSRSHSVFIYVFNVLNKVLLYFGRQNRQNQAVQTYKEECKENGLIYEYGDCRELKEKFYGHLQLVVNKIKDMEQKPTIESRIIGISGESLAIIDDSVPVVNEKVKMLVTEILKDPKGQIYVSRLGGNPAVVETNGKPYTDCEDALKHLEQAQWIKKIDSDGRIFSLTDLGYREAAKLRS